MTHKHSLLVVVGILLLGAVWFVIFSHFKNSVPSKNPPVTSTLPYGKVTLRVGERAVFAQSSLTLLKVKDDSRCATGVTCIWAGTVKAEVMSVSGMGTSTDTIELGKTLTTEAESISLLSVAPYPTQGVAIGQADYRVEFEVVARSPEVVRLSQ